MPGLISRQERFRVVGSTNDVVRGWLADGTPEVCLAVADEQTAGRGRDGRTWTAPAGAALLLSLGFRPTWLRSEHAWRLAAIVSLAMAEAAEVVAELPPGVIRLKWPNDLGVESGDAFLKLAGVLGETSGLGTPDPRVVVGIGVNTNWPAADFPAELAASMTSLGEVSDRPIDHDVLLDAFVQRLESIVHRARSAGFDGDEWAARQVTTGRDVILVMPDGSTDTARATGVDTDTGALVIGERRVLVGEIRHVRIGAPERMAV